jgi:hypothetical protein
VVHDRDPVAELIRLFHVVGREEHRSALLAQLHDALAEVARRLGVEADRRLVEEEQRGSGEERPREHQTLAHPGAELLDVVVGAVGEVDDLEDLVDPPTRVAGRHVVERREVLEVLARRELPVQASLARQHRAHSPANVARAADEVVPENGGGAGRGLEQGGEHPHRGRLAGPIRAENAEDLSHLDAQVDPVDRAEGLALVGLTSQPLPHRSPALLEVLRQADRLDCG